jgi:hypothetical protein
MKFTLARFIYFKKVISTVNFGQENLNGEY